MTSYLNDVFERGGPGQGLRTSALLGAYVKSISGDGQVVVQGADGTEISIQLQTGGVTESHVEAVLGTWFDNSLRQWARPAPNNRDARGQIVYPRADVFAPSPTTGQLLSVASNGLFQFINQPQGARYHPAVNSITPATILAATSSEQNGDFVIGYSGTVIALFRYDGTNTNTWVEVWRTSNDHSGSASVGNQVYDWALRAYPNTPVPTSKMLPTLVEAETQDLLPAANVVIRFNVGSTSAGPLGPDLVDETDAAGSTFAITADQASEPNAFIRGTYFLAFDTDIGQEPEDMELVLRHEGSGQVVTSFNLKDVGEGHYSLNPGERLPEGTYRWAVRIKTRGVQAGTLTITESTFHSARAPLEAPVRKFMAEDLSDIRDEIQAAESRAISRENIIRQTVAARDAFPGDTIVVDKAPTFEAGPSNVWRQTFEDAWPIPEDGYFIATVGTRGNTGLITAFRLHAGTQPTPLPVRVFTDELGAHHTVEFHRFVQGGESRLVLQALTRTGSYPNFTNSRYGSPEDNHIVIHYWPKATDQATIDQMINALGARIAVLERQNPRTVQTLTDASRIDWDASNGLVAKVTIAGDRMINNPTNLTTGDEILLIITQDATGGRSYDFGTHFKFSGGSHPTGGGPANSKDVFAGFVETPTQILISGNTNFR